jgi:hypothetical protein
MLAWLSAPAWADTIPFPDPAAQIDAGSGSSPITALGSFSPAGIGNTGIFSLFNNTGELITSMTLSTQIDPAVSTAAINSDFTCNNAASGNPFFLNCSVTYSFVPGKTFGALTITFFGVNPYVSTTGNFVGAHEGIPPVPASCLPNPDLQCPSSSVGHFELNFLNPPTASSPNVDAWTNGSASTLFLGGTTPTFSAPVFTDEPIPEPGTSTLLAAGLFSLTLLYRRNHFSRRSRR